MDVVSIPGDVTSVARLGRCFFGSGEDPPPVSRLHGDGRIGGAGGRPPQASGFTPCALPRSALFPNVQPAPFV